MKKRNKVLSVFLSLALCVGMVQPALAATFTDLQDAIDGNDKGTEISDGRSGYADSTDEKGGKSYGIEAWNGDDGSRNVQLNEKVEYDESKDDKTTTITVDEGQNVNLDLNGQDIDGGYRAGSETEEASQGSGNAVITVTGKDTKLTVTDSEGDGTITGGYHVVEHGEGFGGGIKVSDNASLDLQGGTITGNAANNGGGVYVGAGTVTMGEGAKIDGNSAAYSGGGVYINTQLASRTDDDAVLKMDGGTISNNTAASGGGIGSVLYAESPDPDYTVIEIENGTITGNHATVWGGGIEVNNGKVSITDSEISNNDAVNNGGGIFASGNKTTVELKDTAITGNNAQNGGGVSASGQATVTMNGGEISNNTASNYGGGILVSSGSEFTMDSGEISHNNASMGGGIFSNGDVTMNGGKISENSTASAGAGVYSYTGSFTMNSGEISGNTAKGTGGGVYSHTTVFTMTGGKLYNNTSESSSDDIYSNVSGGGSITLTTAEDMGAEIDGSTVSRWLWDVNGSRCDQDNTYQIWTASGDAVLRLKAAPAQFFNVTVRDGYSDTPIFSDQLERNTQFPELTEPTRAGYTFIGWSMNVPEIVNGTIDLAARWERNSEASDPDVDGDDPDITIDDPAVPLASGPVTRAEFVGYLWNHEGQPNGTPSTFTDVPADHAFAVAIGWAQSHGMVNGYGDGSFKPDELVTVSAVEAILARFAAWTNAAMPKLGTLTGEANDPVLNCDEILAEFFGEKLPASQKENAV